MLLVRVTHILVLSRLALRADFDYLIKTPKFPVSFFNMTMTFTRKTNNILLTISVEKYFKHLFELLYANQIN